MSWVLVVAVLSPPIPIVAGVAGWRRWCGADSVADGVWRAAAEASNVPVCLSDPTVPDEPLVGVNDASTRVTGHIADVVVGRSRRFRLSGDRRRDPPLRLATGAHAVTEMRAALTAWIAEQDAWATISDGVIMS